MVLNVFNQKSDFFTTHAHFQFWHIDHSFIRLIRLLNNLSDLENLRKDIVYPLTVSTNF